MNCRDSLPIRIPRFLSIRWHRLARLPWHGSAGTVGSPPSLVQDLFLIRNDRFRHFTRQRARARAPLSYMCVNICIYLPTYQPGRSLNLARRIFHLFIRLLICRFFFFILFSFLRLLSLFIFYFAQEKEERERKRNEFKQINHTRRNSEERALKEEKKRK